LRLTIQFYNGKIFIENKLGKKNDKQNIRLTEYNEKSF